ncbi:MAG TPA: hypothetical protein PKD54_12470 [Pirellulaceae bacterium]|nr:hypothetical protein [Pirellulaceae bacterium]
MSSKSHDADPKTLVAVFDSLKTASEAVVALHEAGFDAQRVELIHHALDEESAEVSTPPVHEITASVMVDSAEKWGAIGAGTGAAAGLIIAAATGFPGVALGAIFVGGLAGTFFGGIAGIDNASRDDSVDLPTLEEYREMVEQGLVLVTVRGTHAEVMRAKDVLVSRPAVRSHVFPWHGHDYHEHPR